MRIVADVHERGGAVPRLLSEAGVSVEIKSLSHGDYAIGGGAIVERKTLGGLHAAIINGSFWPQLGRPSTGRTNAISAPGISNLLAKALLAAFGNLVAVVNAEPAAWMSVSGIGPRRAASLAGTSGRPHPASHSPHRGQWHLAT